MLAELGARQAPYENPLLLPGGPHDMELCCRSSKDFATRQSIGAGQGGCKQMMAMCRLLSPLVAMRSVSPFWIAGAAQPWGADCRRVL